MRILTVRQPWAHAIIHLGKDVENRVRNIAGAYRGPVAIHAGLRPMPAGDAAWWRADAAGMDTDRIEGDSLHLGHIIGVVDLVDVHDLSPEAHGADEDSPPTDCSPWAHYLDGTRFHLMLRNPRALDVPIPWKGALGLRKMDLGIEGDWLVGYHKLTAVDE